MKKICNIWQNEKESEEKLEKFSEEKLCYFCLKAMEALEYLHEKNVYYGDMKPENLLVFRNLKVKLGDLGVSVKIPEVISDQTEIYLKGMTKEYSLEEVLSNFE